MDKVIFNNREEIETCYRAWQKRKTEALKFKRSGKAELFNNMLEIGKGSGYFHLGDVANALGFKRTESKFTISVMPKTMAQLRKAQYLPDSVELRYLEQI